MIETNPTPKRIVIYARVSTEHEAQINALENQLDWYKPILAMHPEWQVVDWYVDKGITGTSAEKRPQFMQMIFDAKCGKFDMILTREVSRFARNTVDTLNYTRLLKTYKVDVYFINDNIKTSDGDGEFRLTIMASLSQDESRKTSVRVKAGQQTSFENGVYYGNGSILGYRRKETIDDDNKKHVDFLIEPEQAETVKLIFDMYLDGHGLMQIKDELERQGRLTATGKSNWHCTVISHVLKNSFYCGILTYHKEYTPDFLVQKKVKNYGEVELTQTPGRHEPIVTVEQYERVQTIMKTRTNPAKQTPNGRQCKGKTPPKDIWGRLLVCSCGSGVNRTHWSGAGKTKKIAYRCRSVTANGTPESRKKKGLPYEGYCNSPMVQRWKLEMMAMYIFREFLDNRDEVLKLATSMLEAHIDDVPETDSNTKYTLIAKQEELQKMQSRIDRLMDMRMDGEITAEVFLKQSTETQVKIDTLKDEIEALLPKKEDTVVNYSDKIETLRFALSQYNAPEYFENGIPESVIDAYVEKIVIFEDHFEWYLRFGGNDPIKCHVDGKENGNPEVKLGASTPSLTELEKDRQRSALKKRKISIISCGGELFFGRKVLPRSPFQKNLCPEKTAEEYRKNTKKQVVFMKAYFAGGCFWCMEKPYHMIDGVLCAESGYCGGTEENPVYADVKAQKTTHRETVCVEFDEKTVSFSELLEVFLNSIDPFDEGGQFIDRGRSYTCAVYYTDATQKALTERRIAEIERGNGKKVAVSVEPYLHFWRAEDYHQDYARKNPEAYQKELEESGRLKKTEKV